MKIREMRELCQAFEDRGLGERDIRLGDQIESGPYLHASVGGIFESPECNLIVCANDDEVWRDETAKVSELKAVWPPEGSPAPNPDAGTDTDNPGT